MISGPMPSPGRTATFILETPGLLRPALFFEGPNLVGVAQREADLVQTVQQAVLAERIDLETHDERAVDACHRLRVEVDHETKTGESIALVEQALHLGFAQHHREKAV